jgi:hypothetical protein
MITCFIRYRVDRKKLPQFEEYAKRWIDLIATFGGQHHGYFLPSEGKSDEAICLFTFASLADYEAYRKRAATDPAAQDAVRFGEESGALLDWDRTFYRPVFG